MGPTRGHHHAATPHGAHLCREFRSLLDTVAVLDDLGDLVEWLPLREMPFDLGRFRDARITRPTSTDSIAPVRRAETILEEADDVFGLTSVFAPGALRRNHEAVLERGQQFEVVFASSVVDVGAAEAETRRLMRELLDAEGAPRALISHEIHQSTLGGIK